MMFEMGDYVVYGNSGVCQVEKIGPMDLTGVSKDKIYYTLCPVYSKGSKVFTPVDNEKVKIRLIVSKQEAQDLIDDVINIETLWISDEKQRENVYKEALKKCDCRECIKIIKTLYLRKQSRIAEGKKVGYNDEKYLKNAEANLYGELAMALQMDKNEVEELIVARVEQYETEQS